MDTKNIQTQKIGLICIVGFGPTTPLDQPRSYARTHARMRACTHACMHARTQARMHAHTHARTHTLYFYFYFFEYKMSVSWGTFKTFKITSVWPCGRNSFNFYFNFLHSSIYTLTRTKFHTPPYFFFLYIYKDKIQYYTIPTNASSIRT